jgi:hypothetical protein
MAIELFQAIRGFLTSKANEFNAGLIANALDMDCPEIHVAPRADIGEAIDGKRSRQIEGFEIYPIRYPRDSGSEQPDWSEQRTTWPFDDYCEEIGSTGHSKAGSLWVGFDFDSLTDHQTRACTPHEIEKIENAVRGLDYVEVRRSTQGVGRHLRVYLENFPTKNHTEHKALARAILGKLCHDAGFDFGPSLDCLGGNLWIWSRRATIDNRGFELLQAHQRRLIPDDVPDWRDHIGVVQGRSRKVSAAGVDDESAASHARVKRDAEHDRIIAAIREAGYVCQYIADHDLYRCHTQSFVDVHQTLRLKGAYAINPPVTPKTETNCFFFLKSNGALKIIRRGSKDLHPLWSKTTTGNPCIDYNVSLEPQTVAKLVGAVWTGKGFSCRNTKIAREAARLLGINLPKITNRPINFAFKTGTVTLECERVGGENIRGWGIFGRKFRVQFEIDAPSADHDYDANIRHLATPNGDSAGWAVKRDEGTWGLESVGAANAVLESVGVPKTNLNTAVGACVRTPWILVNEPFQAEFLPGRRWNRSGKKLILPSVGDNYSHAHFDRIFAHIGQTLDLPVRDDLRCKERGITSGAQYLKLWAAIMFQRPKQPLPYLFLWSRRNNTGKSALHRSLSMLMEDGAVDLYLALKERFNQQMAGCVLGFIEDKTLEKREYQKIKGWVDAPTVTIREMNRNAYTLPNYGKMIHSANDLRALYLEQFDERVVVNQVLPLDVDIPWDRELSPILRREAPDFLASLLKMELPAPCGRLYLPVIMTESKKWLVRLCEDDETSTPDVGLDDRNGVISVLVSRTVEMVQTWGYWDGSIVSAPIGKGPWTADSLPGYLRDAIPALLERGVIVLCKGTHAEIGALWATEADEAA